MTPDWISYLFFTLLAIALQGFFAIFEMAAVSFNKIRLQYYVSLGKKRALWLERLLKRPSRLFGTTLIGINTALQVGSECSRRFYEALHLDPGWAPLTQVFIVVIFAELAPMFAARRHPEQLAMSLAPIMALLSRILQPIIWAFDALSRLVHRMMGNATEVPLFFSRDEIRTAFAEREEGVDEWNALFSRIFQLKNQTAEQIMTPLQAIAIAPSSASLDEVRHLLSIHHLPFVPIYHRHQYNIVAVAHMSDLLRLTESKKVLEVARSPWFVPKETSILEILDQFRRNNQSVAIILDPGGRACGILSLDRIVSQIFGEEASTKVPPDEEPLLHIERTLSGEMRVLEFNSQFQADIQADADDTLSDVVIRELGHPPSKGETVRIGSLAFTVSETSLRGAKTLTVQTLRE